MKVSVDLKDVIGDKSGIGMYTYEICKRLQNFKELQLSGVVFNFLKRHNSTVLKEFKFNTRSVGCIPNSIIFGSVGKYVPLFYNFFSRREIDVYLFFSNSIPYYLKGKKLLVLHDIIPISAPHYCDPVNIKNLKQNINCIRKVDKIVTVSEHSKNEIVEFLGVDQEKIEIIFPGVDYNVFNCQYSDISYVNVRAKYQLPQRYILYIGGISKRKNIDKLIEAYSKLPFNLREKVKLVIVGKDDSLKRGASNFNAKSDVIFTDYIEESEKPVVYQMADMLVYPSLYEGFGMPVIEAMAAGIPVITSNVSSLPEVVGNAGLLINPLNIREMADAMEKLENDQLLRKKLIDAGYHRCQQYNWDIAAEKFKTLLSNM